MLRALYSYPDWVIGGIFVVGALVLALVLMYGLRALIPAIARQTAFDPLRIMPTVLTLTVFLVAFAIVQAQTQFGRAETMVATEASAIEHLDRTLNRLNHDTSIQARRALYAYVNSVIVEEWPYMRAGGNGLGHPHTQEMFDEFEDAYSAMTPAAGRDMALFNDVIRLSDDLGDQRHARMRTASVSLPPLFWGVIFAMATLVLSFSAFFQPSPAAILTIAPQAIILGLLVGLLFCLDHPFMGDTSISADIIVRVAAKLSGKP